MEMNVILMGRRIRTARKEQCMPAETLAERAGITPESLGHIECGVRKPSLQTLYTIAETLQVSLDYLTGRTPSSADKAFGGVSAEQALTDGQEALLRELTRSMIPIIKDNVR